MSTGRVCVVMAFDTGMFQQARECIALLQQMQTNAWTSTLVVLDLGLKEEEKQYLANLGAVLAQNTQIIPNFKDAPGYMRAMTCRPYMRDLIPGYDVYVWLDADIRLVEPDALASYVLAADTHRDRVAICQEVESSYVFIHEPEVSRIYHKLKRKRMAEVYGEEIAEKFDGFLCFNAGIFAMHRDSVIWASYRANLEKAMKTPFDHMKEQDAMNVAILQNGMRAVKMPVMYNWLCSASIPIFSQDTGRWLSPTLPNNTVAVLHLACSNGPITLDGQPATLYDLYKKLGMTK